jgi:hypothetical protein
MKYGSKCAILLIMKNIKNVVRSLSFCLFFFGFAGWFYIAENAVFHPYTLGMALTHFRPYPHEDTFGAICFLVAFVSLFIYMYLRGEERHK